VRLCAVLPLKRESPFGKSKRQAREGLCLVKAPRSSGGPQRGTSEMLAARRNVHSRIELITSRDASPSLMSSRV
jgi:hypothetical protein